MKFYVGITDYDWFTYLKDSPELDEVNFWQPSGNVAFRAIEPGAPFLFKLHSPRNYIVGGGFFVKHSIIPMSLAWEAFGNKNGADNYNEFRTRRYRYKKEEADDSLIGCIILSSPFFFEEDSWIPAPEDWSSSIVKGKTYETVSPIGSMLWREVEARIGLGRFQVVREPIARFGREQIVTPRLGQGGFRIIVTDAYNRKCAITAEKTLPALEAAHIKSYSEEGPHEINNGILLRADLHKLFDLGYITITKELKVEVSRKIKEKYENGRDYYAMQGIALRNLPMNNKEYPSLEFIEWHNAQIYLG